MNRYLKCFCIQVQLRSLKTSFGFFPSLSFLVQAILFLNWGSMSNVLPTLLVWSQMKIEDVVRRTQQSVYPGRRQTMGTPANCKLFTPQVIRNWTEQCSVSIDYLTHRITEMIVIMPYLIQRVATILNANLTRRAIYDFFAEKQPNA